VLKPIILKLLDENDTSFYLEIKRINQMLWRE